MSASWYQWLAGISIAGAFGFFVSIWVGFKGLSVDQKRGAVWLAVASLVIWFVVGLRGFFSFLDARVYIPTARYGYPGITPVIFGLVLGWRRLLGVLRILHPYQDVVYFVFLFILDVFAILRIMNFY